jgi:hypothetical protein
LAAGLKPRLSDLASQASLTPSHFHRVFKKHVGVTPGQYVGSLAQSNLRSPDSLASASSEVETPRSNPKGNELGILTLDGFEEKGAGSSVTGAEFPGFMNNAWNEFDTLLSLEHEQAWMSDFRSIDPRIISASD